jgi:hypothetical protein
MEEGAYTIQVTIAHDTAAPVTAVDQATVDELPVVASPTAPVTGVEGTDTGPMIVANFTDPGGAEDVSEYVGIIAWGDNASSFATIIANSDGSFSVQSNHAYAVEGTFNIVVNIQHGTGSNVVTTTIFNSATISDPAVVATGASLTASEGTDSGDLVVATFTDPGGAETTPAPAAHYTASIDAPTRATWLLRPLPIPVVRRLLRLPPCTIRRALTGATV